MIIGLGANPGRLTSVLPPKTASNYIIGRFETTFNFGKPVRTGRTSKIDAGIHVKTYTDNRNRDLSPERRSGGSKP
jgi:hypothetical protein